MKKLLLNQHNEYSGPVCQPLSSLKSWEIASLEKNSHGDFMHEQISSIALTAALHFWVTGIIKADDETEKKGKSEELFLSHL